MKKLVAVMAAAFVTLAAVVFMPSNEKAEEAIKPFESEEDFLKYLSASKTGFQAYDLFSKPAYLAYLGSAEVERFSETNVQVKGIDEPDVVKTDGVRIYYSTQPKFRPLIYSEKWRGVTRVIEAFPVENISVRKSIDKSGELLLYGRILMLIDNVGVYAYEKDSLRSLWRADFNGSYVDSRLYEGKLYVVTRSPIKPYEPCPIRPMNIGGKPLEIDCRKIYHPTFPVEVDSTFTISVINAESGEVENAISFVGSGRSVVYMSRNAIYVAYNSFADPAKLMSDFVRENPDIFPKWVFEKIEKLKDYELSSGAKQVEIYYIIDTLTSSMSDEERLRFENEYYNRWSEFTKKHARELERTNIVKFSLKLEPSGFASLPGSLLSQFSLDEFNGYLRVATTVRNEENDLYILNEKLEVVGKLQGFGFEERIYAVRFDGNLAFIVTFKQTDPFFVIDLSNPEKPRIAGELKIPGFSSYLHRIDEKTVLGIGKDGANVKISLFDVSNASNPIERDRYVLKESWSEVLANHHAFLIDEKHGVFFLPAGSNAYVFSYKGELKMLKAIAANVNRAVYINDYLYVLGAEKMEVYDERSWQKVAELRFDT